MSSPLSPPTTITANATARARTPGKAVGPDGLPGGWSGSGTARS